MKNKLVLISCLLLFAKFMTAQDLIVSQHIFCRDLINPSSFEQSNDVNVFLLFNKQYTGIVQQPNTQIADVSIKRHETKFGITVINDVIGYDKTQYFKLRYARRFAITNEAHFSLGLSGGVVHKQIEATKLTFEDDDDPLSYTDLSDTRFDFDFGAEFEYQQLVVGFSVNHLGSEFSNPDFSSPTAQYYGFAQYGLNLNKQLTLYPNVLARYWEKNYYGELGLLAFYKNKFWLGTNYSLNHNLILSTGFRIAENMLLGYAYKNNLSGEMPNVGITNTHEIFVNFAFNKDRKRIRSVRFID